MAKFLHLSKKKVKRFNHFGVIGLLKENKPIKVIAGLVIIVFAVGYLMEINTLATKGYQIRELENKITALEQEKSDLELEALSLQSMGNVREKLAAADMVTSEGSDYLTATPVAYAR